MKRNAGFTLIELLVAMAIVAIIGVIALTGLNQVIEQREIARERAERWRELQLAFRVVVQDLAQIHPRPMRDEIAASYQPSVLASPTAQFALELSRGGWANPAGLPRGTVARIAYDFEEDTLVRYSWPVFDRTLATPPLRNEILHGVQNVEIRFLDAAGQWHLEWPPLDFEGPERLVMRPKAIEFTVEVEGFGRLWRLVETSG
ncbi:MAG: type II secretion system minor pseudopilin GspJ [Gammaproteobacteria bacterium]